MRKGWKSFASVPFLILAVFLLLAAGTARYLFQSPQVTFARQPHIAGAASKHYPVEIARARQTAQSLLADRRLPGLSVAVGISGEIVWSEGFGYADLEQRVPVGPKAKFRIGSISKAITAAAVAQLYEQGRLDLDAPIQRYVPGFPEKGYPISTRQLAGHLAGIRHYRGSEFLSNKHYATVLEGLNIFKDDPLLFQPGTKYSYSSYGWNLISAVVEGASGQAFLPYMDEQVFQPLQMRHTQADENGSIVANRVRFYERGKDGQFQNAASVDNSCKWAGGGFLSTAEDLIRFASAHLKEGFLKKETLELYFTSQRTITGEQTGCGIAWHVQKTPQGERIIGHNGGSVGGTSTLIFLPGSRIAVAMLTNLTQGALKQDDALGIAAIFQPGGVSYDKP